MLRILISITLVATPTQTDNQSPLDDEDCTAVGKMAQDFMEARQSNVILSKAVEAVDKGTQGYPERGRKLARRILFDAYKSAIYSTSEYRAKTVNEFRSNWELKCFTEMQADSKKP